MRMRHAAVVAGLALGLMSGAVQAAYVVNIDQVGANVVAIGSGSIDLNGLTLFGSNTDAGAIGSGDAAVFVGSGSDQIYSGAVGPSNFGGTDDVVQANTNTGSIVGVFGSLGLIFVPNGYSSDADLGTSKSVFTNVSLADLGLTPFTSFAFIFPVEAPESIDTFTVKVGFTSPVPLPASAPMFGAALLALGAVGYGLKRKGKDAAAA